MENWIWVLIGFIAGIVVYAILNLIFAKDPSDEFEKLADERAAELAKAEMKTAVLQDKVIEAETARDEQAAKSESECQQKLLAAEADFRQKLDAADAAYREKLAMVEQQFANLEAAFTEQAAEVGATLAAAGLAANAAQSEEAVESEDEAVGADDEPDLLDAALPSAAIAADDEPHLLDAALPAAAVAAGAALAAGDDEEEILEATAKLDDEPREAYEAPDSAAEEVGDDMVEPASDLEPVDALETELTAVEEADENSGAVAKAAVAAGGVAVAAAVLSDDDDASAEMEIASDDDPESVGEAAEETFEEDEEEAEIERAPLSAEPNAWVGEIPPFVESEENSQDEDTHAGLAAAAAVSLAASGDDDEKTDDEGAVVSNEPGEILEETGLADPEDDDELPETEDPSVEADGESQMDDEGVAAAAGLALMDDDAPAAEDDEIPEALVEDALVEEPEDDEPAEAVWREDDSVWSGEYFNNMKLEGEPVLVREDAEIDFDWGMDSPAPEVNVDGFSVRWTRTADLPPGLYRFTVTSDDGARLWVNERLVISAWYDHTEMTFRREIELPGGPVDLKLEYYENVMAALVRISWERIG